MEAKTTSWLARAYLYVSGGIFLIIGLYLLLPAIGSLQSPQSGEFSGATVNQGWFLIPVVALLLIASYAAFLRHRWMSVAITLAWLSIGFVLGFIALFGGPIAVAAVIIFTIAMIVIAWSPPVKVLSGGKK